MFNILRYHRNQIRTTFKFHLRPVRIAKINNNCDSSWWHGYKWYTSALLVGVQTCIATMEINMEILRKLGNNQTSLGIFYIIYFLFVCLLFLNISSHWMLYHSLDQCFHTACVSLCYDVS